MAALGWAAKCSKVLCLRVHVSSCLSIQVQEPNNYRTWAWLLICSSGTKELGPELGRMVLGVGCLTLFQSVHEVRIASGSSSRFTRLGTISWSSLVRVSGHGVTGPKPSSAWLWIRGQNRFPAVRKKAIHMLNSLPRNTSEFAVSTLLPNLRSVLCF